MIVYLNQSLSALTGQAKAEDKAISQGDYQQAIIDGAGLRIRPVMMTVTTIIFGLLPIMLGGGTGSELMGRIAAPMVGGMTSAVLLTLIVLPAIYSLMNKKLISKV